MTTYDIDYPAYRLWKFMEYGRTIKDNLHIRVMVSRYLDIDDDKYQGSELFHGIGSLVALPEQVEQAVRNRTTEFPPADVLLRPLPRVRNALHNLGSLPAGASNFKAHYSAADVIDLEHCYYALLTTGTENKISTDKLSEISELADAIQLLVEGSPDLNPDVRDYVWAQAAKISRAVKQSRAAGTGVLIDAVDETVGRLYRSPQLVEKLQTVPTVRDKFWDMITKAVLIQQLGAGFAGLPAGAADLLQLDAGTSSVIAPAEPGNGRNSMSA